MGGGGRRQEWWVVKEERKWRGFGLGNRNGSSVAGIEGKRCPTLTEDRAKK